MSNSPANLSDAEWQTLLLKLAATHTLTQLAARFGVTKGVVAGRVHRARLAALQKRFVRQRGASLVPITTLRLGVEVCQVALGKLAYGVVVNVDGDSVQVSWHKGFRSWEKRDSLRLAVDSN